jgi:integrase
MKLKKLIDEYLDSNPFKRLSRSSQSQYERHLNRVVTSKVGHKTLGNTVVGDITSGMLNMAYEKWLDAHGIRSANYMKQALSVSWRYAMSRDKVLHNPVSLIKTLQTKPRRNMWTRDQVKQFLTTAYSQEKWHGIGLLVHMSYEWGQRVGDMRMLTWKYVDLNQCRTDLTQSKRNAEVHLPISNNLCNMLRQQKEMFGFQDIVAPKYNIKKGLIRAYQEQEISPAINMVLEEANLPKNLNAQDLRRTAITEAVEAGVDLVGIMQFSGHQNPSSLKPYLVNTFTGASNALAPRGLHDED